MYILISKALRWCHFRHKLAVSWWQNDVCVNNWSSNIYSRQTLLLTLGAYNWQELVLSYAITKFITFNSRQVQVSSKLVWMNGVFDVRFQDYWCPGMGFHDIILNTLFSDCMSKMSYVINTEWYIWYNKLNTWKVLYFILFIFTYNNQ